MLCLLSALNFLDNCFRNTIRVDADPTLHFVGPNQGPKPFAKFIYQQSSLFRKDYAF